MYSQEVDLSADPLGNSSSILGKKLKPMQAADNIRGRIERSNSMWALVAGHG